MTDTETPAPGGKSPTLRLVAVALIGVGLLLVGVSVRTLQASEAPPVVERTPEGRAIHGPQSDVSTAGETLKESLPFLGVAAGLGALMAGLYGLGRARRA